MKTGTVRYLSFGLGGHTEHYTSELNAYGKSTSTLSGYDRPETWRPDAGVDYSRCVVVDIRAVVETRPGLAFSEPMVDPDLDGDAVSVCPVPSNLMRDSMVAGYVDHGNAFGGLLLLQESRKGKGGPGPLDSISPEALAARWAGYGARVGRVVNGSIVWDVGGVV